VAHGDQNEYLSPRNTWPDGKQETRAPVDMLNAFNYAHWTFAGASGMVRFLRGNLLRCWQREHRKDRGVRKEPGNYNSA